MQQAFLLACYICLELSSLSDITQKATEKKNVNCNQCLEGLFDPSDLDLFFKPSLQSSDTYANLLSSNSGLLELVKEKIKQKTSSEPKNQLRNENFKAFARENILENGESLQAEKHLISENKRYRATLHKDGLFTVYNHGDNTIFNYITDPTLHGKTFHRLEMRRDGDLVIYGQDSLTIWHSGTVSSSGDHHILVLENDGMLTIYNKLTHEKVWTSPLRTKTIESDENTLENDASLGVKEYLMSQNRLYRLTLHKNASLFVYNHQDNTIFNEIASDFKFVAGDYHLDMQKDGNLVIYNQNDHSVWNTQTKSYKGHYHVLVLENDGMLIIYNKKTSQKVWISPLKSKLTESKKTNTLYNGARLGGGEYLVSENKLYRLTLQERGALIVYNHQDNSIFHQIVAASNHQTRASYHHRLVMQRDGNLVIYNVLDYPFWSTATETEVGYSHVLVLENDGSLAIYDTIANRKVWTSPARPEKKSANGEL